MRFAVAADHAGFPLKDRVIGVLRDLGHEVRDLGTNSPDQPDDYPDFAASVAGALREGTADRAVLICGSGVGASIAANKAPGIRAAVCHDTYSAHQGVEHDDMNVLCIGSRVVGEALTAELVRAFAGAAFSGEERHVRRLRKILAIEQQFMHQGGAQ
jgi:ribose 5-phosphate isomerase B